jgi:hypothetical protein
MTNMEKFNEGAAQILSLLYENFPVGIEIKLEDFPSYDNAENSKIFSATIAFLKSEGFISYADAVYGGYMGVVLTAKGFTALNSPLPEAISGSKTLGDKIKDVVKIEGYEGAKTLIREIIRVYVGL